MEIVGITGFKRSGKGTVADSLFDQHPGVVYTVGFADKLKVYAARSLGFLDLSPRDCIALMDEAKEDWLIDCIRDAGVSVIGCECVKRLTGRQYLQWVGTEARKLFGEDFWVDQVLPRPSLHPAYDIRAAENAQMLRDRFPEIDAVAITDLRFPNEAQRIKQLGGVVWEVLRPDTDSDGHDSEQVLPRSLIDWEIHNNGTIDDLYDKVSEAIWETL